MHSAVEKLAGLSRKLTVTVPKDKVESAYQSRIKDVAKTAKLKGFRPGKAPLTVIEKQYGLSIRYEVAGELMQSSFEAAVKEHDLRIAGQPQIQPKPVDKEAELQYEATFEVYPEIDIKDLKDVALDKTVANISDSDVEDMLTKIRRQYADWQDVTRASKSEDRVTLDFEGFIDGDAFEGGQANNFQLELGSNQMIPGFEDGIMGKKAGEEFDIKVTFPEQYPVADLAGKASVFKIKLHKVQEPKLPELDQALLEKIGFKGGDVQAFRTKIKENMQKELDQMIDEKFKAKLFDKLLEINSFDIPNALIELEVENLQNATLRQMAMQQGSKELPKVDLPKDPYIEQAKKRVMLGLLLGEVIKSHNLTVADAQVRAKVTQLVGDSEQAEQMAQWYYQNERLMSDLRASVLEELAIDKLMENAKINENSVSYEEFVKLQQGE